LEPGSALSNLRVPDQRAAEFRAEAAAYLSARRAPDLGRFSGLQIRFGRVLIMIGRTFGEEKRSPRPVRS
jgi:hypothetical protein